MFYGVFFFRFSNEMRRNEESLGMMMNNVVPTSNIDNRTPVGSMVFVYPEYSDLNANRTSIPINSRVGIGHELDYPVRAPLHIPILSYHSTERCTDVLHRDIEIKTSLECASIMCCMCLYH